MAWLSMSLCPVLKHAKYDGDLGWITLETDCGLVGLHIGPGQQLGSPDHLEFLRELETAVKQAIARHNLISGGGNGDGL